MSRAWNPTRIQLSALALLVLCGPMAAPPRVGAAPMDADKLRAHVEFLASDELQGRETGEPGCQLAEEYIRDTFSGASLETFPGFNGYFADFELQNSGFSESTSWLSVVHDDATWQADPEDDFRPFPFSASGSVSGDIVFAGYGITAEEHDWDDYAGLDVAGKIVLVLRYEPGKDDADSPFDGTENSTYAYFTSKERNARDHGAAGMILVHGPLHGDEPRNLPFSRGLSLKAADGGDTTGIAAVQVRHAWLRRALRQVDVDLRELQEAVEDGRRPADLPAIHLTLDANLERSEDDTTPARNVVAFVPGADPELSQELIVVGAHHDHVGMGSSGRDRVFNGADDNASGTAVLLELARAWRQHSSAPARSVVFVTFTAEEKGLLGSRALVQGGQLPLDRVRFMINLDMVGRNADRPIQVLADPRADGLHDIIAQANRHTDLPLSFENERLPGNSDHSSFRDEEIPVLFFFTGTHDDYHQPGDHADKLDYERMADIGTMTFDLLEQLATANSDEFPNPRHDLYWLGAELTIEGTPAGVQGVFTTIEANSTASAAGLQVGDIVTAIGTDAARGDRHVGSRLQDLQPDQRIELTVQRNGSAAVVEVTRAQPGFLGIAYAALSVEDRQRLGIAAGEGVLVQQVLPQGPAADAGLLAGDIILRVANEPARHRELAGRLQAVGALNTVEMQILRDGETLQRKVRLAEMQPTG